MKKTILFIALVVAVAGLKAQETRPKAIAPSARLDYTMKLDSVVGSDDFGWTRWKNEYTYIEDALRDDALIVVETSYEWQDQAWVPTAKTETGIDQVKGYRWTEEGWEHYLTDTYQYLTCGETSLIQSVTTERLDSVWVGVSRSTYEYDDDCHLVLNMYYYGFNEDGEWKENAKYVYSYNENGLLDTCLYSTIRNGNWRESQREIYTYDDQHQCMSRLIQSKGGWGPMANTWSDAQKYEFEYENGELVAELCYVGGGWFGGGTLNLDSKMEYEFDSKGNLLRKTGSIYNGQDWIPRDVFENRYNSSIDVSSVLGLSKVWETTLAKGMGFANGDVMPLVSQWLSCSIVSSGLDTEFTLYCSGFAGVGEQREETMKTYSRKGCLGVECPQSSDVTVYDLLGRVVASKTHVVRCEFNLVPGFYLVSNGNTVVKTIVR